MVIKPNLSKEDALKLAVRLHTKIKEIDYTRAFHHRDFAALDREELHTLVTGLDQIKQVLEFHI